MSFRTYRPLLPAGTGTGAGRHPDRDPSPSDTGSTSQPSDPAAGPPAKRRHGVTTACFECRSRKKKCDGARPTCGNCTARSISRCAYPDGATDTSSEILRLLRSLSVTRARAALSIVRAQNDEGTALNIIKGHGPKPDSDLQAANSRQSDQPPTRPPLLSLEDELSTFYPNLYLKLCPVSIVDLSKSHLVTSAKGSGNPSAMVDGHEDPQRRQPNSLEPRQNALLHARGNPRRPETRPIDGDSAVRQYRYPLSADGKPADHPEYYDPRLKRLDMSYWTNVEVSNEFAARAISLYLETDHPLLGLFDPELFITDLVEKRVRYCSPFLVNALMYLSCQMYIALDKQSSLYITPFWNAAEILRVQRAEGDSPCTMAALVLMSLSLTGYGKDHDVIEFSRQANAVGDRLGFFDPTSALARKRPEDMTDDDRMCCHAAWSSFNWSMIIAIFHRQPEVVVVDGPPAVPILEYWSGLSSTTKTTNRSSSSTSTSTPSSTSAGPTPSRTPSEHNNNNQSQKSLPPTPALVGATFTALCQFWRLMHGAIWVFYPDKMEAPPDKWKWTMVEHKIREILAWTSQLPDVLSREEPHVSQVDVLHMWTHAALMDLLRPFTRQQHNSKASSYSTTSTSTTTATTTTSSTGPRLTTFSADDNTVLSAYKASTDQLKRLILDYRTNHEVSAYSILWHTGLLYLVNAMLEKPRDPDWHVYFLLCIHGYETLRRPYLISEAIAKSLLVLTLRKTDMSSQEARGILAQVEQRGGLDDGVDGGGPVDGTRGGGESERDGVLQQRRGKIDQHHHNHHHHHDDGDGGEQYRIRAPFMADLELALRDPANASVEITAALFDELALFNEVLDPEVMYVSD